MADIIMKHFTDHLNVKLHFNYYGTTFNFKLRYMQQNYATTGLSFHSKSEFGNSLTELENFPNNILKLLSIDAIKTT